MIQSAQEMQGGVLEGGDDDPAVTRIAEAATSRGLRVAVAESLTSGLLAATVGAGPNAGDWFAGGVVA